MFSIIATTFYGSRIEMLHCINMNGRYPCISIGKEGIRCEHGFSSTRFEDLISRRITNNKIGGERDSKVL